MKNNQQLRTFLVTGCGRKNGLGFQLASHLAKSDAVVHVTSKNFHWSPDTENIIQHQGDISESEFQQHLSKQITELNGLVNNASTGRSEVMTRSTWMHHYLIHCVVPYELSQLFLPALTNTNGSIVNVSSSGTLRSNEGNKLDYTMSKVAMNKLTQRLANELSPNVRVNAVCPGLMETQRFKELYTDAEQFAICDNYKTKSLTNCTIPIDDTVTMVQELLSNSSMTGTIIPVCAGMDII